MSSERSDDALIEAIGARDVSALEVLYARYGSVTFSLASRITGNRETAEEVVQETFLAVWRRGETYRADRGSVRSWVLGITHHRAIDVVRARASRGPTVVLEDEMQLSSKDDLWSTVQQTLDHESIQRALASLPPEQRQSIELAYFGGLTYPEIARTLGVPLGTIKSRLRLGLEKLRVLMTDAGAVEPEPR